MKEGKNGQSADRSITTEDRNKATAHPPKIKERYAKIQNIVLQVGTLPVIETKWGSHYSRFLCSLGTALRNRPV
jgi:hypothetical protein